MIPSETARLYKRFLQNAAAMIRAEPNKYEPGPIHYPKGDVLIATWELKNGVPFFKLSDGIRAAFHHHKLLPWAA